jgi:hypothetical protein
MRRVTQDTFLYQKGNNMYGVEVILNNGITGRISCNDLSAAKKTFEEIIECVKSNNMYKSWSENRGYFIQGKDVSWIR